MPNRVERLTHRLINQKRRQRGLPPVEWSGKMYRLAKDQSRKMARAGRLLHSGRYALQGGENISGGKGHHSPRDFVRSWMRSPEHRAWLLDPGVKTAAVGISSSRRGTYAAWSFSDQPLIRWRFLKGLSGWLYKLFHTTYRRLYWNPSRRKHIWGSEKPRILIWATMVFKWSLKLLAAGLAILGIHGLWIYFSRIEANPTGDIRRLFLSIQAPGRFQDIVGWMSTKGIESWFFPALFIIIAIVLWRWSEHTFQWEFPQEA